MKKKEYKLKSRNIEYKIYKSSSVDNCESSINNNKSINLNNYSNFKKLRPNSKNNNKNKDKYAIIIKAKKSKYGM